MPFIVNNTIADDACCICLQNITKDARVQLPCGHNNFCGQCLVTHMLRQNTCPVCRQGGHDDMDEHDDDHRIMSNDEPLFSNSRTVALELARKDERNQDRFARIKAFRKEAAKANKEIKELQEKTRDAQKVLLRKQALYEAQLDAAYSKKYGAIEAKMKDLKKASRQAIGRAHAMETCLAKKYAHTGA